MAAHTIYIQACITSSTSCACGTGQTSNHTPDVRASCVLGGASTQGRGNPTRVTGWRTAVAVASAIGLHIAVSSRWLRDTSTRLTDVGASTATRIVTDRIGLSYKQKADNEEMHIGI